MVNLDSIAAQYDLLSARKAEAKRAIRAEFEAKRRAATEEAVHEIDLAIGKLLYAAKRDGARTVDLQAAIRTKAWDRFKYWMELGAELLGPVEVTANVVMDWERGMVTVANYPGHEGDGATFRVLKIVPGRIVIDTFPKDARVDLRTWLFEALGEADKAEAESRLARGDVTWN